MTEHARAAVFLGPGKGIELREIEIPALSPGQALVRIACATVCGSDIHSYLGHRNEPAPSILGHEIIGEVVATETGDGLARLPSGEPVSVGQRITWSVAASCGRCKRCRAGLVQKCERLFKYGHQQLTESHPLSGGLATHCILEPGTHAVELPEILTDEIATPASCATATVAAAQRVVGDVTGGSVLVVGAGMLGLTACAMASDAGASAIGVVDVDPARLERTRSFGATTSIDASHGAESMEAVAREAAPGGWDAVIELSGDPDAVESAIRLAAVGGRVVLVGSVRPTRPVGMDPERLVRGLVRVEGLHNYVPADLERAVGFLEASASRFPFASLVERSFALDEAPAMFAWAAEHRPLRAALRPRG